MTHNFKVARYDISALRRKEKECRTFMREHFKNFFQAAEAGYPANNLTNVMSINIAGKTDVMKTYSGAGLYLVLTNYPTKDNPCTFAIDNLRCIYRGHCATVKSRLMSHLLNADYWREHPGGKVVRYDVCMKLDEKDGITITDEPYSAHQWRIIIHKMKGSSKAMREQAELGFDDAFNRPIACMEPGATRAHAEDQ